MLNRTNIILIVLLVVQMIVGGGLALTSNSTSVVSDDPLLANFSSERIIEVIIEDDLGKEIQLALKDDGWILPSADDFPVNGTKVEDVLNNVGEFKTNRLIATNPTSHARLEVEENNFRRKLTLVTNDGNEEILFGTSGGVDTTHTRRVGDNNVYLTSGLNSWEIQTQVSSWIDSVYIDIEQDAVTRLILTNASGTYEFVRDEIDWTYLGLGEDEEFDTSKMSSLLRNATNVRMTQPLGLEVQDDYGIDDPEITIQVFYEEPAETEDTGPEADNSDKDVDEGEETAEDEESEMIEQNYTLTIGNSLDNDEYVIKADNQDYYVLVRSSFLTTFRNINHDELLVVQEDDPVTESG